MASEGFRQAKSSTPTSPSRWSVDESDILCLNNRIYVLVSEDLHLCVLQNNHDHILAGHFGQNQTLELVRWSYTWPQMCEYVRHYIKSCTVCSLNKTPRHCPYGVLKPLPVPECLWDSISMDFIEQLPDSKGFTAILIVIDHASKPSLSLHTTPLLPKNSPSYSSFMFSLSMVFLTTSPLTAAPSLSLLHACRGPPLHTDFTHRLHLNKPHHQTAAASGRLPFTYSISIFHFRFILLFHILNLEPESGSEQTSIGFHRTPTRITYLYIYCRITCRYSVRISTWFSQISL